MREAQRWGEACKDCGGTQTVIVCGVVVPCRCRNTTMAERPTSEKYGYDTTRCPHDYAPCPFCATRWPGLRSSVLGALQAVKFIAENPNPVGVGPTLPCQIIEDDRGLVIIPEHPRRFALDDQIDGWGVFDNTDTLLWWTRLSPGEPEDTLAFPDIMPLDYT